MENKKTYRGLMTEARRKDTIVVGWGRFNPPTVGHEKLIEKISSEAQTRDADYRIYPTKTADPKKNPLSFPQKVKFMRAMFPKHARKISPDKKLNTLIKAAQALEKEGYTNLVLVAGSDRVNEFNALLNKYNGKDYSFDKISVVSAGERDPDAEGVTGMSASKMRAAAASKDLSSFKKGVPRGFKDTKSLFDTVRKGMNLKEEQLLDELSKDQKSALTDVGADVAIKALKGRKKKKDDEKEVKSIEAEDYSVTGPRFNRLLRFGLSPDGTADIPLTKRAFKNMAKAGPNPMLRTKIFQVIDKTFTYLLDDDILYNRFIVLLHRKEIFGEDTMNTFEELTSDTELAKGLQKKAAKADIPYDIVAEVYVRGLKSWETSEGSYNTTPDQWAFARVNSFCSGGKTIINDDADLWEEYLEGQSLSELDEVFNREFVEEAPPSAKAERFIKKNKDSFKKQYGDDWEQALYSTAWKMHKKHWEDVNEDFESEFAPINELFEKELDMIDESKDRPGNAYDKAGEWGTNDSMRAYKADTPGETPDVPYNALASKYETENMFKNNKMPEPFHKQAEKKEKE